MVKITLDDIFSILAKLLCEKISRENASDWAIKKQNAFDALQLSFIPKSDEDLIWDALDFLISIDLQTNPKEYLYSKKEILDYKVRISDEINRRRQNL